jgi:3-deoxy-manno-octulosonate cytidylyltransferase (CMP-KDO synthetase)
MSDPLILIPSRLGAVRLPNKPLADIEGVPMVVRVWRQAVASGCGPVAVATDSVEIASLIEAQGGKAVMTRADHQSGSDRIFEAAQILDPEGHHDVIINLQGDLPTIDPKAIAASLIPLSDSHVHIASIAAVMTREEEKNDPNVVKVVGTLCAPSRLRALYFTRATAPFGDGPLYHHIGLYAYRRTALAHFMTLPPSPLEQRERLEQLRAMEAGMRIDVMLVDDIPISVDTPDDLERARRFVRQQLK